jgi:hypothetical protein
MAIQFWASLSTGFRRRWRDGLVFGFGAVGAAWTLTEFTTRAIKSLDAFLNTHGGDFLGLMFGIFCWAFLARVFEPRQVTFLLPPTDTRITLKYGDIFSEDANLLLGVNEFFDGELGQPVQPNSVHGQFIIRNYNSNAASFRSDVDAALAATGATSTATARLIKPDRSYPIGTTARVSNGSHQVFLMAMAKTDLTTSKASSDPALLWTALQGGLRSVHDYGGGNPIAMPLFGNGQAGINLKPQHLLRLLALALVDFGRNSNTQLPKRVIVVLHERCFEELDIREIARDWKKVI